MLEFLVTYQKGGQFVPVLNLLCLLALVSWGSLEYYSIYSVALFVLLRSLPLNLGLGSMSQPHQERAMPKIYRSISS